MNTSLQNCPVPPEQQPLNEYLSLQNSWFFGWSTATIDRYCRTLALLWFAGWLFSLPFAIEALVAIDSRGKTLLAANAGSIALLLLIMIRLYLGWRYIRDRLERDVVEYEETGWYDGQVWEKTPSQRDREMLISTYEVRPLMHRLGITIISILGLAIVGMGTWPLL